MLYYFHGFSKMDEIVFLQGLSVNRYYFSSYNLKLKRGRGTDDFESDFHTPFFTFISFKNDLLG
jgi:hypothetical protein